jgi:hypothetical protein
MLKNNNKLLRDKKKTKNFKVMQLRCFHKKTMVAALLKSPLVVRLSSIWSFSFAGGLGWVYAERKLPNCLDGLHELHKNLQESYTESLSGLAELKSNKLDIISSQAEKLEGFIINERLPLLNSFKANGMSSVKLEQSEQIKMYEIFFNWIKEFSNSGVTVNQLVDWISLSCGLSKWFVCIMVFAFCFSLFFELVLRGSQLFFLLVKKQKSEAEAPKIRWGLSWLFGILCEFWVWLTVLVAGWFFSWIHRDTTETSGPDLLFFHKLATDDFTVLRDTIFLAKKRGFLTAEDSSNLLNLAEKELKYLQDFNLQAVEPAQPVWEFVVTRFDLYTVDYLLSWVGSYVGFNQLVIIFLVCLVGFSLMLDITMTLLRWQQIIAIWRTKP